MKTVGAAEFKANCPRRMDQVRTASSRRPRWLAGCRSRPTMSGSGRAGRSRRSGRRARRFVAGALGESHQAGAQLLACESRPHGVRLEREALVEGQTEG
ncbi:MAG: hypothetical protein DIJKHBIC_04191 [Thermoanaerobaculia bacterium]|nr:hypothetical protein [Thermoanaerobaculia bacterium]